jgi:hypothetical protein
MDLDAFAADFIARLDAGEFDGRVTEVALGLTAEQLLAVIQLSIRREKRKRPISKLLPESE